MSDITPLNPEPTYSRREEHLSYVELSKLCKELEGAVSRAALAHARDFTAWKRERRTPRTGRQDCGIGAIGN